MYPKACACGLDVPETHFPSNLQEMTLIAPTLAAFPYLVKPAAKFETRAGKLGANLLFYETYRTKALRCRDETELLAVFDDVCRHGVTPIVQQEIPGPASDLWAIDFYANRNSDIIQYHTGRKLRQYPSDFGTCTLGCTVERDELVGLAARVVKQLSFHGIGNVEFKQRDGKLYFLELNPRAWQWLHLATASGSNLPMTAYRDLTGGELPERSHKKRASVVWVDIRRDTEHVSLLKRGAAASDGLGILTWISSVRRARVEAISCLADPFPLIVVSAVRLWTRLVRRLLARPCREPLRHERDAQY
jgi:predicted ATP-grasp superfamily ATP-dependent carboligase